MKEKLRFAKEDPFIRVKNSYKEIFNFLNLNSLYSYNNDFLFKKAVSYKNALNFPDGFTISKFLSIKQQRGPSFMARFLNGENSKEFLHFFIGLSKKDLPKLAKFTSIPLNQIRSFNPSFIKGKEFSIEERIKIIKEVNKFNTDYLWICVGHPKQEILGFQIFDQINVKKIFNVGAALDFLLKRKKESPLFFRKIGLEWLYLGFTNPKRTLKKIRNSLLALTYLNLVNKSK
ncbi:MAG: WecB/TagA/CpsF family glycosyltransferase [Nanoarchaeota archaeon]|nr:WecB/TagA/CpsF family glycosyltransferase [Nanoarchaeota archaeon]